MVEFSPEQEISKLTSRIYLRFSRHEKKADSGTNTESTVPLTPQGRIDAASKARLEDVSQAIAFSSPRVRSQETALLELLGKQEGITGSESLNELKDIIDENLKVGSKLIIDKRLDFNLDENTPYGKWLLQRYKNGDCFRAFLLEGEQKAKEFNEENAETSAVYASNISEFMIRYIKSAGRWDQIVNGKRDNTLSRYFVSHGLINESFLGKIIEEMSGKEQLTQFIDAVPNGFDFHEGFETFIDTFTNRKTEIKINYEHKDKSGNVDFKFNQVVPQQAIEKLILPKK